MKPLVIGIFSFFLTVQAYAQSYIGNELKSIVQSQMFDATEKVVPVFVAVPGWYFYGIYTNTDQEIYFREKPKKDQNHLGFQGIVACEIQNNIPLVFLSSLYPENFQINSFYNDHLSVTFKVSQEDSLTNIEIANMDGSFRREAKYCDERLKLLVITNSRGNYITQFDYSDTLVRKTTYNTSQRKYRVIDEYYNDNLLLSRVIYNNSKFRNTRRVDYTEQFTYDPANRLTSVKKYSKRKVALDSTLYISAENYILENLFRQGVRQTNKYIYNENHAIVEKSIDLGDNKVNVTYDYDDSSHLTKMELTNRNTNEKVRFSFIYDSEFRLSELNRFDYSGSSDTWAMKTKFILKYNSKSFLESISRIESNGQVSRFLRYD
ncbi:MAG: hypothetical protein IPH45_17285 [Bacteroidales bacterium]|nr:hypothetical protein [Bacteroidales bacterium]